MQDFQQRIDGFNSEHIDELFTKAEEVCRHCHIKLEPDCHGEPDLPGEVKRPAKRIRRLPAHLKNFVVTETLTVGHTSVSNPIPKTVSQASFRDEVYLPVINCMIDELKRRFSIDSCAIMRGVQSLNPHSNSFLEMTSLNDMAAKYNIASDDLVHEVYQAERLLDRKAEEGITTPGTLQQVINKLLIHSDHNDSSIHLFA